MKARCLKIAERVVAIIWLVAQIALVAAALSYDPASDSAYYLRLAQDCVAAAAPYPLPEHIATHAYIANPGYINLLAPVIAVAGAGAGLWLNIVMNCLLLLVLRSIVGKLCGERVRALFVIFFCCLPSGVFIVASYMSDLPCALAGCAALWLLCLSRRRSLPLIAAAGFMLVIANYIRPVAVTYAAVAVVYLCICRAPRRAWLALAASALVGSAALIGANKATTGHWWLFSTTGGCNLLQGASDEATGTYCADVFEVGHPGEIAGEYAGADVFRKDSIWRAQAIGWIKTHPAAYAALAPQKIYHQMFADSYHTHLAAQTAVELLPDGSMPPELKRRMILESVPYYAVLLMAAGGAIILLRRRRAHLLLLAATPIAVNLIIAALIVGAPRYHYPAMPAFLLLAAIFAAARKKPRMRHECLNAELYF